MGLLETIASGGRSQGESIGDFAMGLQKLKMQKEQLDLQKQTTMENLSTIREKKQKEQQKTDIISSTMAEVQSMGGTEEEQERNFAEISISRAKAVGDLDLVKELKAAYKPAKKPELFSKADRAKYTDDSVKAAEKTGKQSDLRLRPEVYAKEAKKLGANQHLLPNGSIITTSEIRAAMDEDFPKTSQQELILLQATNPAAYVKAKAANLDRPSIADYTQLNYGIDITGKAPTIKPGQGFETLPPASQHKGKTIIDKLTGDALISDGENWIPKP